MAKNTATLREFSIFCYTCKKPIKVRAEDEKQATGIFRKLGHSDDKVPALAPNLGRKHRRFDRAIAGHLRKQEAAREARRRQAEKAAAAKKEADHGA